MAALHDLEQVTVFGAAAMAVLTLLAPLSRSRLVAAWVLLGTAVAAVVIAGPNERMYPAYAVVLAHVLAAWLSSRRVTAAPRMSVWRKGTGRGEEHVTAPASGWRLLGRVALFFISLAALALPVGWLTWPLG